MILFHLNFVKKSLQIAGFIINEEKSVETISKFDLVMNKNKLKKQLLLYTNRKTVCYKNSIVLLIKKLPYTTARELGKACRKLIPTKFALEHIVQLKTRNLHKVIENQLLQGLPSELNKLRKGNQRINTLEKQLFSSTNIFNPSGYSADKTKQ